MTFIQVAADTLTLTAWTIHIGYAGDPGTGGANPGSQTQTFTFPKTGHYMWAIDCRMQYFNPSQNNAQVNVSVGGSAGIADSRQFSPKNGGSGQELDYSLAGHGQYSAGATITFSVGTFVAIQSGNHVDFGGGVYMHFVPVPGAPN